ncbi:hypothetical protein PACTADRAFT_47419 [Pachysolen tannophilus NRRL Y-2460]|uniref:AP-3 complex subunit delta n=1 Tax=Pachysolen tannophilus NRRL Y-2460 TaxID=669874 RepID=A0A1E4U0I4_PACTA|nr:hypothetical protein PACTADRAFT_47419 [Pachysolen tannophilus NRRL Y-2460]
MSLVDVTADQFRSRLRPFGISFEKSLSDLIKGIRSNNNDKQKLSQFFNDSIQECRKELKSNDPELKSTSILKLTYLEMYGFDLSFCSFQILEVMSSNKFQHKRIGYLAAIQILTRDNNDDVLMLMTNLLKKDLNSSNYLEVGLAISCLSSIVTKELAQDVIDDLIKMLTHTKPFIRKKAILASFKIFLKYPNALRLNYNRLIDRLDDEDVSVVSATVNVICELAKKNPKNYIELAPRLFDLLVNSNNNWMIIRLLKLFSSLSIIEPRLKKKLLPSILEIMSKTKASSLIYECINCILTGNMLSPQDSKISKIMIDELLQFLTTNDLNLKYVSILAFIKIINIQPSLIREHQSLIMDCLKDQDLTIRSKSLDLVDGLIDEDNVVQIVSLLLIQLAEETETLPVSYRTQITKKILSVCSSNNYALIPNFHWFLITLKDLIKLNSNDGGLVFEITQYFVDIGLKIPSLRHELIQICIELIKDEYLVKRNWLTNCMWCVGEYFVDYLNKQDKEESFSIINYLISDNMLNWLKFQENSDNILPIYIESLFKIFVKFINADNYFEDWDTNHYEELILLTKNFINFFESFQYSLSFEIQERAINNLELLKILLESLENNLQKLITSLSSADESSIRIAPPLFLTKGLPQFYNSYELKPIALGLQLRISLPDVIDFNEVINDEKFGDLIKLSRFENDDRDYNYYYDDENEIDSGENMSDSSNINDHDNETGEPFDDEVEIARKNAERELRLKDDPYYISMDSVSAGKISTKETSQLISLDEQETQNPKGKKKVKPKKKHVKKEKVLILQEEDVPDNESNKNINKKNNSTIRKQHFSSKSSKFRIDSSNLDNFDISSSAEVTANDEMGLPSLKNDFNGEYEVEQLRKEMATSYLENKKPKKTTSKTKKKKKKDEDIEANTIKAPVKVNKENTAEGTNGRDNANGTPDIKEKKKKIKKKKAIIN